MTSASAFGFAAHSYDAVMVLAAAIKQANSTDGSKVREALENLQTPYDGMMKNYDKPFSKTEHEALGPKTTSGLIGRTANCCPTATTSSSR